MEITITKKKEILKIDSITDESGMIETKIDVLGDNYLYSLDCYHNSSYITPCYTELYVHGLSEKQIESLFYLCSTIINQKKYDLIDYGWKIIIENGNRYCISFPNCIGNSFFKCDYGMFNYKELCDIYNILGKFLNKFKEKNKISYFSRLLKYLKIKK